MAGRDDGPGTPGGRDAAVARSGDDDRVRRLASGALATRVICFQTLPQVGVPSPNTIENIGIWGGPPGPRRAPRPGLTITLKTKAAEGAHPTWNRRLAAAQENEL